MTVPAYMLVFLLGFVWGSHERKQEPVPFEQRSGVVELKAGEQATMVEGGLFIEKSPDDWVEGWE